ncbi:hypothetical protein PG987_007908 [Apiospora arundinis]
MEPPRVARKVPTTCLKIAWDLATFFRHHALCLVFMNRMLSDVYQFLGTVPASGRIEDYDDEARTFSRRIWLSHQHAMRHWPLGSSEALRHMILSYEAGDAVERAFVLGALRDLNRHRTVTGTAVEEVWTNTKVLSDCMLFTGRVDTSELEPDLRNTVTRRDTIGCYCSVEPT